MQLITFDKDSVSVSYSFDTTFAEYSFGITQGINWIFGQGGNSLKIERRKSEIYQHIEIKALVPLKPLIFSGVARIGSLAREGYWVKDIPFESLWTLEGKHIRDGHHRLVKGDKEKTILQSYGLDQSMTIGEMAFGLADLTTGFFWLGAKKVKYQGSIGVTQVLTDKGFEGTDVVKYLTDNEPEYSVQQTIDTLE